MQQTHTFYILGMHCSACVVLTEGELTGLFHITQAKASLKNNTVIVTGEFGDRPAEVVATELSVVLTNHGYSLSLEKPRQKINWREYKFAIPIALGFIALFVILQKLGIVNLVSGERVGFGTAFIIGVVASLSSCFAVVGGLIISLSATMSRQSDRIRPQLFFHISRLVAFFLLGGVIGAISASFQLTALSTFFLNMAIGLIMFILGLNLLNIFHWTKFLQPRMPKFLSKRALNLTNVNHTLAPALLGLVTFFLPCGFTQSMQIYALSTGSFMSAGLIMLFFALGTLPVLAILSFSSFSLGHGAKTNIFFKTAGIIIILFAIYNIANSLAALGVIPPIFYL